MTYKEGAAYIGKKNICIKVSRSLVIAVKVLDYKTAYGMDQWLVTPVKGKGTEWVRTLSMLEPTTDA